LLAGLRTLWVAPVSWSTALLTLAPFGAATFALLGIAWRARRNKSIT
jgi:hypothetical protein